MSSHTIFSPVENHSPSVAAAQPNLAPSNLQERNPILRAAQQRARKMGQSAFPVHFSAQSAMEDGPHRQAELFYLQKQIQSQTPMIVVLEDGEQIEGCIEWYDRTCLKVRGRAKTLIYKSAIKYMYKVGEQGH